MKTIFQSESGAPSPVKCKALILADGAIEEFFSHGATLNMRRTVEAEKNMSILIEVQDAQTDKVIHSFVVTSSVSHKEKSFVGECQGAVLEGDGTDLVMCRPNVI